MNIKTKEEAKALDAILARFTSGLSGNIQEVSQEEIPLCEKLEAFGYIKVLNRDRRMVVQLTEEGNRVKANGGFMAQFEEEHCAEKEKKWNLWNTKTSIITTVIGIVTSLLVFFN
jgi:hypothetical protein